ncbi:MAG: twin-arginine translocase TatA/TatE family subunit [Akkermansiaceae bacterium]|nr:twin-arginine translocase TatA/TatE family subunit [Akkermansiaceae bacterium]|tara:strand:- start:39 stop:305 length:267 start_codon:yes stop_codon:yes gene_type:complete
MTLPLAWTLGGPEIAVIFLVVLLLFGAKKIPELARGLGKSMGEFKKARTEFEDEIKRAEDESEHEDDDAKAKEMAKEASGKEETDHHA